MTADRSALRVGLIAALLAGAFSILYDIAQALEWSGALGSNGGPNSASTAIGIVFLLVPSLLLGPAHVAMMAALYRTVGESGKIFGLIALALGIGYATLTGLVYFVQITFVAPRLAAGELAGIELLRFVPYQSFLFAIDLYGYSLMCGSALCAGLALRNRPEARLARTFFLLTGLLVPALALQMQIPELIWVGAIWAVSYPVAALALMRLFQRNLQAIPAN